MSKFKLADFTISSEKNKNGEMLVTPIDNKKTPLVRDFELTQLKKSSSEDYSFVKSKYGPLASTDDERSQRLQQDRRFSINPLLRDPLSIEQEERRVIEEKVRLQIQALTDEAKAEASIIGYQDGLKKGFDEGLSQFCIDGASRIDALEKLTASIENAKMEIFRANERFLMELIFRIARMVILKELAMDREYLLRLAKELISKIGAKDNLILKIHPNDIETVGMIKGGLDKAFGELMNLNIESSIEVKRGGCQVETEWSSIDASVETQLEGLYQSLIGKVTGGA